MIYITKTAHCDFSKVTKDDLLQDTLNHRHHVVLGMNFIADIIKRRGRGHDYTKISLIDEFHSDFLTGFVKDGWWKKHQDIERHHLSDKTYVQDDVDLIDVIEMIVDCVMAGMARRGEYRHDNISPELLVKAYNNTVKLLLENVEVVE